MLTDGIWASSNVYDGSWVIANEKTSLAVEFDLGSVQDISLVKAVGFHGEAGIPQSKDITVYVSDDGVTFTQVTNGAFAMTSNIIKETKDYTTPQYKDYLNYYCGEGVSGRYVRVYVNPQSWAQFVCVTEIEVYGV